jgi:hypothetical protein
VARQKKDTDSETKPPKKPKSKKQPKSSLKLVKPSETLPEVQVPDGFRVVSVSQAMMEFAGPFIERVEAPKDDIKKVNEVFSVIPEIWNYTSDTRHQSKGKKSETEIISLICKRLGLDKREATEFLEMMVDRRHFLFPQEVQPKGTPFFFMRKQAICPITAFDYESLDLTPEILRPNATDKRVIVNLKKLDQHIRKQSDYDKFGSLHLKVQEGVLDQFSMWLEEKNVKDYVDQFVFIIDSYLTFIYGYEHGEPITLESEPGRYVVEFVADFLLRKTLMDPWEYTLAPPALILFYVFLYEKEYLEEPPEAMMGFVSVLEPRYLEVLAEQFS